MKQLNSLSLHLLIVIGSCVSSCATFNSASKPKKATAQLPADTIVRQAAMEKSLYGKYERQDWVDIRNGLKDPVAKVMATLATAEWQAAESEARSILLNQPAQPTALVVLATALSMQKKFALSSYYAQQLQKQDGQDRNATILNLRALALLSVPKLRMTDIQAAIQLFNEAFQGDNGEIAAGLNVGHLYLEIGRADTASDIFAEVGRRCGDCIASLLGSGIALGRKRDYVGAKAAFKKIIAKDQHHSQALYRLAMVTYQGNGNIEEAKRYIDVLNTYAPENDAVVRQRAEALVRAMDAEQDKSKL